MTVMVTRPAPQGEHLCRLIQAHGGRAIHFPTIAFVPPPDPAACHLAIAAFDRLTWLVFISPHSVDAAVPMIREQWPRLPSGLKIAAVGEGTARVLENYDCHIDLIPAQWNSEGLLAAPEFQAEALKGKGVAVIRGEGGRELIDKILAERGAHVLPVIAYQRIQPDVEAGRYLDMLKQHTIDIIVCASFESVSNLKSIFGVAGWQYLRNVPLLVVSERIRKLAGDLGFQTIFVSRDASDEAVLEALAHFLKR